MFSRLKLLLPDRPIPLRVLRGPFRGAKPVMNPRHSLRKMMGLYERELNDWIEDALKQVSSVVDVGANDGYFAFGCAAAFRRLGKSGRIVAIEAQTQHIEKLKHSLSGEISDLVSIELIHAFAGRESGNGFVRLDELDPTFRRHKTLIKIDVEGAEIDVIEGAKDWMHPDNLFLIEVHHEEYLTKLRQIFDGAGLKLIQIDQQPHPILGRECRDIGNWWLVSEFPPPNVP